MKNLRDIWNSTKLAGVLYSAMLFGSLAQAEEFVYLNSDSPEARLFLSNDIKKRDLAKDLANNFVNYMWRIDPSFESVYTSFFKSSVPSSNAGLKEIMSVFSANMQAKFKDLFQDDIVFDLARRLHSGESVSEDSSALVWAVFEQDGQRASSWVDEFFRDNSLIEDVFGRAVEGYAQSHQGEKIPCAEDLYQLASEQGQVDLWRALVLDICFAAARGDVRRLEDRMNILLECINDFVDQGCGVIRDRNLVEPSVPENTLPPRLVRS